MKLKMLLIGGMFVLALPAAEKTLTGTISDGMCGADHSAMAHDGKKASPRDCTLMCAKEGTKYVFVSSGQVYTVTNQNLPDLPKHAGHDVTVTGDLASDGKTLTISKVQMR